MKLCQVGVAPKAKNRRNRVVSGKTCRFRHSSRQFGAYAELVLQTSLRNSKAVECAAGDYFLGTKTAGTLLLETALLKSVTSFVITPSSSFKCTAIKPTISSRTATVCFVGA